MNEQKIYSSNRGIWSSIKSRSTINYCLLGLALAVFGVVPAKGQPAWYDSGTQSGIEPGSPDFYQHQPNENPAFINGGWCAYFAFEDAMYYDANTWGFSNLYANNNANWVAGMTNNFYNILDAPAGANLAGDYSNYITNQGYGSVLGVTTTGNSGSNYSAYTTLQQDLIAGSNTLIYITNSTGTTNQWWGFHVMDVVGFTNHSIIVLDPDNNKYGGGSYPGTNANPPLSGTYTNGYGVGIPYNLVYYNTNEPVPVENGWGDVGGPTNSLLQSYTVDANGDITSGIYAGTYIGDIYAIGPVPEPSSIAIGLAAAGIFGTWRAARRKKKPHGPV